MDENYQKYLGLIETFYTSKNHYLTNKDKYSKCAGCDKNKDFIESNKEIILSCGDKGKCGKKIEIILPKYIYKDHEIYLLKTELEKYIDWDIISKHIKVDQGFLDDNKELLEKNNRAMIEIKEKYYEVYKKNNVKMIEDKYKEIIKLKNESQDMKDNLKDIDMADTDKKQLKRSYIGHINSINVLYSEIRENIDSVKEYYLESEPVIVIENLDFIVEEKEKKKVKKKKGPKLLLKDLSVGMGVEIIIKEKLYKGTINKVDPELKTKVMVMINGKEVKVPISRLKILTGKKDVKVEDPVKVVDPVEDPVKVVDPVEDKVEDPVKVEDPLEEPVEDKKDVEPVKVKKVKKPKLKLEDFKIGMKVLFVFKKKSFNGVVKGINEEKGKLLVTIDNKDSLIPPSRLSILD